MAGAAVGWRRGCSMRGMVVGRIACGKDRMHVTCSNTCATPTMCPREVRALLVHVVQLYALRP